MVKSINQIEILEIRFRQKIGNIYLSTTLGGRFEANILVASSIALAVHFSGDVKAKTSSQFLRVGMTLRALGI